MGQARRKLGQAKEALGYYELYLRIEPDPAPEAARRVYKRPWFWGVVGGASAVLTAGIVTGMVLGTRGSGIPDNIQIQT